MKIKEEFQESMLSCTNQKDARQVVEQILEKYRMFLLMVPEDLEPSITASYKLVPSSNKYSKYSSTEDIVIKRIDQEKEKQAYIFWVQQSVNRLNEHERAIIIKRYLNHEDVFDYEIYNELGFSETKYYRLKSVALNKLSIICGFQKYS